MAANGNLIFQDTNKATFVGANSNVVIDTVHASFGVGVDVNGPTSNLHVVGNAYVTSNLEVGTANLFVDTVNSRVGVGTTDPNSLLELSSATGSATITPTELRLSTTTNAGDWDTTNPWGKISFYSHDTSNGGPQVRGAIGMSVLESFGGYGRLGLFTENSGTLSERVSITHAGNVGIGTTSPQDITHIWKNGANDAYGLLIEQNNAGTGSATLKFGVAHTTESTAGLSKAGIFFRRGNTNGRGDLLFCMDNADDTNDVDTSNHALTIYRDGNVGIGTTSPQYRLDVGDGGGDVMLRVMHQTASSGKLIFGRSGTTDIRSHAIESYNSSGSQNNYMKFLVHDGTGTSPYETRTEVMTLLGNGNVGIGTTNPDTKLEVKFPSNDGSQPILSLIRDGTMSSTVGATFRAIDIKTQQTGYSPVTHASINLVNYNPSGTGQFGLSQPGRQDTGFGFSVIHDGSTVENALVISSIGNVGIGTTSPDDKLHLYGATDSTLRVETDTGQAQLLLRSGASTRRACRIDFSRADTGTQYMQLIGDYQQNGTDDLTVATSTSGRIMTWLQNGNVGIGTTSPNWPLEVSAGNDSITYYGPNSSWSSYLAVGAANDKTIANNTAIAQCITTNGNLHLDAAATRSMYLNHYSGNAVYYQSTVIHGSDDRLKSEEELITNATDTLLKLNPQKYKKAYTLREDESREPFTESGLMAQDVWYDAPELRHLVHLGADANPVDTKPEAPVDGDIQQDPDYSSWGTETAALNYDGLIAYLIKSNQELHARIQALENA